MQASEQPPLDPLGLGRAALSEWQVESLRLTGFTTNPDLPSLNDASTWYERCAGGPPEIAQAKLKENALQVEGPFANGEVSGRLVLSVAPFRFDWRLLENVMTEEAIPSSALGPFPEALSTFVDSISAWLPDSPPVDRLALGVVATLPVADRPIGYVKLASYVPFEPDPNGSDFLYQINRPRLSRTVAELPINRLMRWSVGATGVMRLLVAPGGRAQVLDAPQTVYCRAELDINTAPGRVEPLTTDSLGPLLAEFGDLAREILGEGDRP